MNEIRLSKDTVLRLGPGVVWDERGRYVIASRGRGALGTLARRLAVGCGAVLFVGALSGAAFVAGTSVGATAGGPTLAGADLPAAPPPSGLADLAHPAPRASPAAAAAASRPAAPRPAADPNDPFGLRR